MSTSAPAATETLRISGMTCANCVHHVEKALRAAPGVKTAVVNLATETARVQGALGLSRSALVAAVKDAGYGVRDATANAPARDEGGRSGWRFWKR